MRIQSSPGQIAEVNGRLIRRLSVETGVLERCTRWIVVLPRLWLLMVSPKDSLDGQMILLRSGLLPLVSTVTCVSNIWAQTNVGGDCIIAGKLSKPRR